MKWSAFSAAMHDLRTRVVPEDLKEPASRVARLIEISQRFYLPSAVNLLVGKRHADIFDLYRLPFDCITVLSDVDVEGVTADMLTIALEVKGETLEVERIASAEQLPADAWVLLINVLRHPAEQFWVQGPGVVVCKTIDGPQAGSLTTYPCGDRVTKILVDMIGPSEVTRQMIPDTTVVTNLCAMLGLGNVGTKKVAAPKMLNAKRQRKGKALLLDYHVLKVDGELWDTDEPGNSRDSNGLRSHLRRGHIRRLGDGRRVWVRASYVHGRVDGFVGKDYEVGK